VSVPGVLIALAVYRLPEPRRGHGDRLQLGVDDAGGAGTGGTGTGGAATGGAGGPGLFAEGVPTFLRDMVRGLVADLGTITRIPTMRYALVGVSAVLFTVIAVAAALPQFYERQLHVATGTAELLVGAMVILGGIPGVLLGGPLADRYAPRVRGGRMAIPALCLIMGESIFVLSYLWLPLGPAFGLQVVGLFVIALAVPSLRAGLSDAVPANLRGAGFGAFNLVSVVGGQAAASVVVFALAGALGGNFRTALLLVSIPVFGGALVFLRARDHFDRDAAKILEAVARALQEQQVAPGRSSVGG
jgi:MFS family permease